MIHDLLECLNVAVLVRLCETARRVNVTPVPGGTAAARISVCEIDQRRQIRSRTRDIDRRTQSHSTINRKYPYHLVEIYDGGMMVGLVTFGLAFA